MAESSSGKLCQCLSLVICLLIVNGLLLVESIEHEDVLLVAGGLVSEEMFDTPMALIDNTLCTSLPNLPQKRRAGFMGMVNGSIIFCGGRSESNLPINSDCWKLDRSSRSWEASISLPRSLSRATAVGLNDTLWVFGGVVEESYYQSGLFEDLLEDIDYYHESQQIQYDYYDYVIDETSNDVLAYNPLTEEWTSDYQMPIPLQGSCAVQYNGKILLLGGKNEKLSGSSQVLQFDPATGIWSYIWPNMTFQHYNHGCTLFEQKGYPAMAVGGGLSCDRESSEIVEFLILPTDGDLEKGGDNLEGIVKWNQFPNTNYPHAYTPAMAFVKGFLYIVGGGDIGLMSHDDKIERYEKGKWWSFGKMPVRAYGSSAKLPSEWIQGCSLEPNLGIHNYHQKRTRDDLKGRHWLCFNNQLILSDLDETAKVQNGGCTVPGCHYPKIFGKNTDQLRNKSFIDCQVQELGMPSYHVECILNCRPGWSPINGINTTMCSQENQPFQLEKLTNFTVDYLECGRVF